MKLSNNKRQKAESYRKWCQENGHHEIVRDIDRKLKIRDNKKKAWLYHLINTELPTNFINNKREVYRKEYLKSDHWRALRIDKILTQQCCEHCCDTRALDVHHLNYRNLYDVTLEDLQVLCRRCHNKAHEQEHKKRNKYILVQNIRPINPHEMPSTNDKVVRNPNWMPKTLDPKRTSSAFKTERRLANFKRNEQLKQRKLQ